MRRNKPWFGPIPALWKVASPVSWEGWAVTLAFLLGMVMLKSVGDVERRAIALLLWVAGYVAVVVLTWSRDPD